MMQGVQVECVDDDGEEEEDKETQAGFIHPTVGPHDSQPWFTFLHPTPTDATRKGSHAPVEYASDKAT